MCKITQTYLQNIAKHLLLSLVMFYKVNIPYILTTCRNEF